MSNRNLDWRSYVDVKGDFELPNYMYRVITDLMKQSLDLGTLLSTDQAKLRAYKEQVKKLFKKRWLELAQALEFFELVVPCSCNTNDFCDICGGSRYQLNETLTPTQLHQVGMVLGAGDQADLADKLQAGLMKALKEVRDLPPMPE